MNTPKRGNLETLITNKDRNIIRKQRKQRTESKDKQKLIGSVFEDKCECEICGIAKFQLFWDCSETSIEKKILYGDQRIY